MTTPFTGLNVWLWNLANCSNGSPEAIVAQLQSVGASGALIKVADGTSGFNDWNAVKTLVAALRAAGLGAYTWSYHYDGSAAESAAVVQAVTYCGSDGHVFDAEAEMEALAHPDQAATALVSAVRAGLPNTPLAYAPIGSIRNHLKAPYRQFTDAGCAMLPQLYWVAFQWSVAATVSPFYADVATYSLAQQPIYPAYEDAPLAGAEALAADVEAFCTAVKVAGAAGVSVWSYEHLDPAGWLRVQTAAQHFPAPTPVIDWQQRYKALAAAITEATQASAPLIQSAINELQAVQGTLAQLSVAMAKGW